MPETYDLKYIAVALGLRSATAARKRVEAIRRVLTIRGFLVYDPKRNNTMTVTLEGLNLLQRANDFGGSIAENATRLRTELVDSDAPPDAEELRELKQTLREWQALHRDEHKELDRRLKSLEKLRWWERLLGRSNSIAPPAD